MKGISHDYSDHDESKAREMSTLQLKYPKALLFITIVVLQQQDPINHTNHPNELNSETPFLWYKIAVLLLKLKNDIYFWYSDLKYSR